MKNKNKFLRQEIYALLFFCVLLFASESELFAAQTIKINIPDKIYNASSSFTLGSIAKITGGRNATRKILSGVMLYPDGNILSRSEVLRAINDSDASDARIELYMPQSVIIESPGYEGNFTESSPVQDSSPSRSAQSLAPLIKNLSAWTGDVEVSAKAPVPEGKLIDPASIIPGTQAVTLRFRDNNGRVKSLAVRLAWSQNVMVASHNIRKGDRIQPRDLLTRRMNITRPGEYASRPEEITGFISERNIKQGEPILLNSLTSSNLVKKGRRVKILARIGAASASVDGILLEDGRPGDMVKVRRSDNRKIVLEGKIINENLVEVQPLAN
ncbi:MAG: flagellar basal body P-ring formation protein FlgA [Synergistaceae bacterium]|nr:flagellar basal body P-ring formation protein FlgA [Synergistaceae bacterium]